jgi:hypothetical protein
VRRPAGTLRIDEVAYHRNGSGGEGFHVVRFTGDDGPMLGVVFEAAGHVAVFNSDKLAEGTIAFMANSWRGDAYEPALRAAVVEFGKLGRGENYGVPSWKPANLIVRGGP